ncbi:ATP-binding cassette domain-containing protein [Desulfotignum phosphitoxidans]|uniref:Tungstate transport system ATP-binding protein TupC n=1 Tax=Desulfotignum phosphitoxidans DSM 13687 TaxID=1286635 RepID=S0G7H9_9BACT|nr:ATP-binding cassette domain-containing protein [Desulfotignum phosphitoxidans]EMS81162.1 tungstate transport system ATP-binding protein TupC [Desulfotignum phosphitoxidans DSM 13687]
MTFTPPAYRLDNVTHFYGDKQVLDIAHLEIPKGAIIGLMGPNGSGKSTLLKILAFAMRPSSGHVWFNGTPQYPFSEAIQGKVSLVTQKPYLLKRSVFDNIAYGLKIRRPPRDLKQRVQQVMAEVGLDFDRFAYRQWHELSGGEAQRVALAARLILRPEVLLLDEPVASVDTRSAALIRKASLAARQNRGTTLVITSHDLPWLFTCSDTQLSINNGALFATGQEITIPGPYTRPHPDNPKWTRYLGDGQVIQVPPAVSTGKTAVIQRKHIRVIRPEKMDVSADNQIRGQVQSMYMTGQHGDIMTTIDAGGISFMLGIPPGQASELNLQPGMPVILAFNSWDIRWH